MMVNSEVKEIIEKMLNDDRKIVNGQPETAWTVLVNNNIFSRAVHVPIPDIKAYEEKWEEKWVVALRYQLSYLKEFVVTSINLGLGIPPLNEEGSVVALAVYNAAMTDSDVDAWQFAIPSEDDCAQEFYRLILQNK